MTSVMLFLAASLSGAASPAAPPPSKVLVLPFEVVGFDASLAEDLSRVAAQELGKMPATRPILRADIAATFTFQAQRALAGCQEETACLADVGAALAADKLLVGRVARLGEKALLSITLIDVARMDVDARRMEETPASPDGFPGALRKLTGSLGAAGPGAKAAVLPLVPTGLKATTETPDIVIHSDGATVGGNACFELLPSGRIPGEIAGTGLILPLFGCVFRERSRLKPEPVVAVDQSASTSLVLRVLYTLGRAEFGAARLLARTADGGQGVVRVTLPATQVVGCKEKWAGFTDGSIPVSVLAAEEGLYVGGPGALLPGPKGPGVDGPTVPALPDGQLDQIGVGTLLGKVRKAWPRSYVVMSPSPRLNWAGWAPVLAVVAGHNPQVLVASGVSRGTAGGKVDVRVITSRPAMAAAEPEPEFTPGMVVRGGASGFTLRAAD